MRVIFSIVLLVAAQLGWAACDDALQSVGSRDDVLVIVNDNAVDSCEVGLYYAEQRNLGKANILHIKAPTSYFIHWTQFEVVREQVFRGLQAKIAAADPSFVAASCAPSTSAYCAAAVAQVRAQTGVKILVTTWGIPSKIANMPGGDTRPAAFDDYLRISMVNYIATGDVFPGYTVGSVRRTQIEASGYRPVQPATDAELVIGRIDGLTANSAKALVDRAIGAEKSGLFGKAYWEAFNDKASFDARYYGWIYQPTSGNGYVSESFTSLVNSSAAWRYVFGVFDEQRNQCVGYAAPFYLKNATEAPVECKVKMERAGHFGLPSSQATIVDNSLLYLGNQDGQPTYEMDQPFTTLLNWQKAAAVPGAPVSCGLCTDATCRAASTDVFKEIDTRCAGVADGFVGYNFQSWPMAYLASWPTGWYATNIDPGLYSGVSGDLAYFALPEVVAGGSDAIGGALYFGQSKSVAGAVNCFSDTGLGSQTPCVHRQTLSFGQGVGFAPFNYAAGIEYELTFSYRKTAAWSANGWLSVQMLMNAKEPVTGAAFKTYNYGSMLTSGNTTLTVPAGTCVSGWCTATFNLVLNPAAASAAHTVGATDYPNISYNGLKIVIKSNEFQGDILFDAFSLVKKVGGTPTAVALQNASFDDGHRQFSTGDFAASYLSRLNGTAFFGSMAHHRTSGYSFAYTAGDNVLQFYRGMPLGEAVWLGNGGGGSGVLYGDPLFSPAAVAFDKATLKKYYALGDAATLSAKVRNGLDPLKVSTSYSVDYCLGKDFYVCDRNAAWVPAIAPAGSTPVTGTINLGNFTLPAGTAAGPVVLRLNVTASRVGGTETSTLHDFAVVGGIHMSLDDDNDGLIGSAEITAGTNPLVADTDSDGSPDGWEVSHGYDPLVLDNSPDSDGDGLRNQREQFLGSNPNNIDSDDDGYPDQSEVLYAGPAAVTNPSLHPTNYPVGPLPRYAGVGHLYQVVVPHTSAQMPALTKKPVGASLSGDTLTWTPSPAQVGLNEFRFLLAGFIVKVIPLDGDLNEDGVFNIADLVLMEKIVLGTAQPTQKQIFHADYYPLSEPSGVPDDKLDLSDLLVMKRKLLENP